MCKRFPEEKKTYDKYIENNGCLQRGVCAHVYVFVCMVI